MFANFGPINPIPPCAVCGAEPGADHAEDCNQLRGMRAQAYPEIIGLNGQAWWINTLRKQDTTIASLQAEAIRLHQIMNEKAAEYDALLWTRDMEIEALKAGVVQSNAVLKGYEIMLTHFEDSWLEQKSKVREMQGIYQTSEADRDGIKCQLAGHTLSDYGTPLTVAALSAPSIAPHDTGEIDRLRAIETAAIALLADVRRRYPGEALRCPFMIALDEAVSSGVAVSG